MSPNMITGILLISIGLLTQCIFTHGNNSATKACKAGWTQLNLTNSTYSRYTEGPVCVKINPKNATYLEAVKQCQKEGGQLATILNDEYQTAIHDLISGQRHWIGLSDFNKETSFSWISGYPSVPAAFWAVNEPNDEMKHQDCVAIDASKRSNESWFDEYCTQSHPSVCMSATFKGAPSSVVLETENGTCPKEFFRMGNRCMKIFSKTKLNFENARKQCQKLGNGTLNGDLASVYSATEQNILTAMMAKEATALWIGLRLNTDISYSHTHIWVRGLYPVTFTNWKRNEPNGGLSQSNVAEKCVMMYKRSSSPGEWNDKNCDAELGYICGVDLIPGENDKKDTIPFFASEGKCRPEEIEFDNYCYKSPDKKFSSYKDADNACQEIHKLGHLATPHNAFDVAFTSVVMNHLNINYTLLGFQIKETKNDFQVITADKSSDIGLDSLKGVTFYDVKDTSCIGSTADPQHKVSITNCSKDTPFKAVCNYPLDGSPFHPKNNNFKCNEDWKLITGGRCIKYFGESKSMKDANKDCATKFKGSLISILNPNDQQAAANVAKKALQRSVWIGLEVSFGVDGVPSMSWVDRQPVLFVNWRTKEPSRASPSGKEEPCVVLRAMSTDWNNVRCSQSSPYICSMPGTPPSTAAPPTKETPTSTSPSTLKPTTTPTSTPAISTPTTAPPTPKPKPKPKPVSKCPKGFKIGPSQNCYKIVMESKTWHEAEDRCKTLYNSHLVSIHKQSEQLYVHQLIKKSTQKTVSLWIGLSDLFGPAENQFSYWSDYSPLTVMFMNKTQSSYFGNQDCVVFTPTESTFGVWNMKHCTTRAPGFICMTAPNKKPSTPPTPLPHRGNYCINGFVKFNNTCYKLMKTPENYTEADKKCKSLFHNGHRGLVNLARINYEEDNDFLLSLLSPIKNGKAWIGMHHDSKEDNFHWIDNKPVHYTKWPVNMTYTDKEKTCVTLGASTVMISTGYWYATHCFEKYPFLCQAPPLGKSPQALKKCESSYTPYRDGKTCYRLLDAPATFDEGKKQCEADKKALGLKTTPSLLSIDNVFEMSFIRAWMVESGAPLDRAVWIGLKLKKDKPVWKWITGAPVDFTYTSGLPTDPSGCYFLYVHRKIVDGKSMNVYGMHPDPKCGNGPNGKQTVVCKYSLESKAVVPKPKECLATKDGVGYTGHQAVTKSGKACVRWDTLNDIRLLVNLNHKISGSDSNFCRNPSGKPHQRDRPYCYTTRGKSSEVPKWEFCDIPLCSAAFAGHVGSHSYVVAVAILVIVLLVTISFFVGVMLWRRTNTARGFIPYLRQHDPEGGTSFHNPIYTPAANC